MTSYIEQAIQYGDGRMKVTGMGGNYLAVMEWEEEEDVSGKLCDNIEEAIHSLDEAIRDDWTSEGSCG